MSFVVLTKHSSIQERELGPFVKFNWRIVQTPKQVGTSHSLTFSRSGAAIPRLHMHGNQRVRRKGRDKKKNPPIEGKRVQRLQRKQASCTYRAVTVRTYIHRRTRQTDIRRRCARDKRSAVKNSCLSVAAMVVVHCLRSVVWCSCMTRYSRISTIRTFGKSK